jgi:hypothetical protein
LRNKKTGGFVSNDSRLSWLKDSAFHLLVDYDPQILRWLKEMPTFLLPEPMFKTDAPEWVDTSLRTNVGLENYALNNFIGLLGQAIESGS